MAFLWNLTSDLRGLAVYSMVLFVEIIGINS